MWRIQCVLGVYLWTRTSLTKHCFFPVCTLCPAHSSAQSRHVIEASPKVLHSMWGSVVWSHDRDVIAGPTAHKDLAACVVIHVQVFPLCVFCHCPISDVCLCCSHFLCTCAGYIVFNALIVLNAFRGSHHFPVMSDCMLCVTPTILTTIPLF